MNVFQEGYKKVRILNDVVGITVENENIKDLPEPIRISFHHDVITVSLLVLVPFWSLSV